MEFSLNPRRVITIMLVIIIIIVLAALHISQLVVYFQVGDPDIFDFIEMIDFDYEENLPSFYSSAAIFFCAALLWVIGGYKRKERLPFRFHWLGLAIILVCSDWMRRISTELIPLCAVRFIRLKWSDSAFQSNQYGIDAVLL